VLANFFLIIMIIIIVVIVLMFGAYALHVIVPKELVDEVQFCMSVGAMAVGLMGALIGASR